MSRQASRTHNQSFPAPVPHIQPRQVKLSLRRNNMENRAKQLRATLVLVGLIFIVGLYSLIILWPSGWAWHMEHSYTLPHYLQMIVGVYVTLGIFLLIASRDPMKHLSLIWFTVWSSAVHAGIMAMQAIANRSIAD